MRLLAALVALTCTGCMAFSLSQNRTLSARGEAKRLAKLGVVEIVLGTAVAVASYYWYINTDPEKQSEESAPPRLLPLLGILAGIAGAVGGVADEGIAVTQAVSNGYVMTP